MRSQVMTPAVGADTLVVGRVEPRQVEQNLMHELVGAREYARVTFDVRASEMFFGLHARSDEPVHEKWRMFHPVLAGGLLMLDAEGRHHLPELRKDRMEWPTLKNVARCLRKALEPMPIMDQSGEIDFTGRGLVVWDHRRPHMVCYFAVDRARHQRSLASIRVNRDVQGVSPETAGQAVGSEILQPNTGMKEVGLVTGNDEWSVEIGPESVLRDLSSNV